MHFCCMVLCNAGSLICALKLISCLQKTLSTTDARSLLTAVWYCGVVFTFLVAHPSPNDSVNAITSTKMILFLVILPPFEFIMAPAVLPASSSSPAAAQRTLYGFH